MMLLYRRWEAFCKTLQEKKISSTTAAAVLAGKAKEPFTVLKHDVETNVKKAYAIAKIEHRYGHCGSYYVQAYLLRSPKNVALLQKMQAMGHEITYHYDVLDFAKGDMTLAMAEYAKNLALFEENGFAVKTVCQHGNPVVERVGYTSNRDFFRSDRVQALYPTVADVMVDLKRKAATDYTYYSDAGRRFKMIFDPLENDRVDSEDKNVPFEDLGALLMHCEGRNAIISMHPHRWGRSAVCSVARTCIFRVIRACAKLAMKVPILKKFMSRYYHLAKKL